MKTENPQVEIKLLKPKSIRGEPREKGDVVTVHKGVADWLIKEKSAVATKAAKKVSP